MADYSAPKGEHERPAANGAEKSKPAWSAHGEVDDENQSVDRSAGLR
jgi:hypothetical protein